MADTVGALVLDNLFTRFPQLRMLCQGDGIRAVIDWEIWSIGDRRNDLGAASLE